MRRYKEGLHEEDYTDKEKSSCCKQDAFQPGPTFASRVEKDERFIIASVGRRRILLLIAGAGHFFHFSYYPYNSTAKEIIKALPCQSLRALPA